MPHSAAQRQAGDTSARDDAGRHSQSESVGGMIYVAPLAPRANQNRARGRIHSDEVNRRQIDHQSVITDPQTGGVVAAATHGDLQTRGFRHSHGRYNIGHIGTLSYQPGAPIDHCVVNLSRLVIGRIAVFEDRAAELAAKLCNCVLQAHLYISLSPALRFVFSRLTSTVCRAKRSKSVLKKW
jgi:hypothetical protein